MRAVDVRVGHDQDPAVAQRVQVEGAARAGAEDLHDRRALGVVEHLLQAGLLHVEDLAADRQQRLVLRGAGHPGGAQGAVALDDEQLAALDRRWTRQSTSFGGIDAPSRAVLRRAASFCCFWVSRTRAASTIFCRTVRASVRVRRSSTHALMCCSTSACTTLVMPAVDSSSLVCEVNCGSGIRTWMTAVMPSRTSSRVGGSSLALSRPRVFLIASPRARTTARSKPLRWVPPCTLRMVLVKHSTVRS